MIFTRITLAVRAHSQLWQAICVALLFGMVGTVLLLSTKASTPTTSLEVETGALSGNGQTVSDESASSGSTVHFGVAAPTYFGTLTTSPSRAQSESAAGVKAAMLEISWRYYETGDGVFNASYIANMKSQMAQFKAAGMPVTLSLGLHFSPDWVKALPNSAYVDQNGKVGADLNVVFNQKVREKVQGYLDQVDKDLGMENFWAIRLNSGGNAEMLYPGGKTYFAYDVNAQNGPDMPPTMERNPLPGWKPGDTSVIKAQVGQFADWYIKGLDNVTDWQMNYLDSLGFKGYFQTLTPGSGVRPNGYTSDINTYLPPTYTAVGAVWSKYYEFLPRKDRVVVYVSSVADNSGGNTSCDPSDNSKSLTSTALNSWGSTRWQARIAHEYGLPIAGENPGYGLPASLQSFYTDTSENGMMATAIRLANTCGLQAFYWAHDYRLYDGTQTFANYKSYITALHGSAAPIPALP